MPTRDLRRLATDLMTSTFEAIKLRYPDTAVASLGRLLEEDRDRAQETLPKIRRESLDLRALSQNRRTNAGDRRAR